MSENKAGGEKGKKPHRPMVRSTEAQRRLIETTIALIRVLPFDQVTARKITEGAELSLPTISRNFASMVGLFARVADELLERSLTRSDQFRDMRIFTDPDFVLRTKLVAWLLAEGASPEAFRTDLLSRRLQEFQHEVGEINVQTAGAWMRFMAYAVQGFVVFSEVHTPSQKEMLETAELFLWLRDKLPEAQEALRWDT